MLADPGLQQRAQEGLVTALAVWQAGPGEEILAEFSRYAQGDHLAQKSGLSALFGADGACSSRALIAPLIAAWIEALHEQPLGIPPLRHQADPVTASLLLAAERETILTLVATDGTALRQRPEARSVLFYPAEIWEIVVAGAGAARLIERSGEALVAHDLELSPGLAMGREAGREALVLDSVEGCLVVLRLQRRHETLAPRQEIDLATGKLLRQSAATPRESRHEVAVALLGRMGRKDAAPLLAEIARDQSHGDSLRWQALRECLGLDTATGFWTLTAVARAGSDPLAIPAGALRAQLLETHPQLAEFDLCHA